MIYYRQLMELVQGRQSNNNMKWRLICPPPSLCTDNGVMAAWAGIEKLNRQISDTTEDQEPIARWPMGEFIIHSENAFTKKKML